MVQPRLSGRLTSRWLRLDGREMHYLRSTGPQPPNDVPVVFLHGMISGRSFERVAELVAPYYRCYIPDLPGMGGSENLDHPPKMSDLIDIVLRWMDHCDLTKVHLAGQSFGCNLGVELAVSYPDRIASLTLQAVTLEPERRTPLKLMPHWILSELREKPKGFFKKSAQQAVSKTAMKGLSASMMTHPLEQRLPHVLCPSQVLHGTHDFVVSSDWAEQVALALPHGRLVTIPGATHTMNARQPEAYADALLGFLKQLPSANKFQLPAPPSSYKGDSNVTERPSVSG